MPDKNSNDVLKVQGRMTLGYGIIPKMPMQDNRLTIEAKAIYSYFCSYAGAGTTAFPSRNKILRDLQIGEMRYYKHFNLLKQYGYISVEQNTDNTGKFKNNIYTLVEMIEPCPQNRGAEPYHRFPGTDNPHTVNDGTKTNSPKSNNFNNINNVSMYNQQSESTSDETEKVINRQNDANDNDVDNDISTNEETSKENEKEPPVSKADQSTETEKPLSKNIPTYDYNTYLKIIQDHIEYNHFKTYKNSEIDLIDEIVNCILDVVCTQKNTVKIGGEDKNRQMVISQYLKLNSLDIEHVIERFKEQEHKITHIHSYLKTALYNCKQEQGHYYTNAVRADGVVF